MVTGQPGHRPLIEVLYVRECPHYAGTLAMVERLRGELGIETELRTRPIGDQAAAERAGFPGSPTIRVDGRDVEPGSPSTRVASLACRLYRHEHGVAGQPAEAWVRDALLAAGRTDATPAWEPPLPGPDGPLDPTVSASPIEEVARPGRFTLMAAGWLPPTRLVTQALGLCFTADGLVVLVTWDGRQWTFPGGTVEDGETVEQALVREVAEEACARVVRCQYLASQHVADPLNPDGVPSYYQSRWWARVELDPWQPQDEMIARRLVTPDQVLDTLTWQRKEIAHRLLQLALDADQHDRARWEGA
jgi:8-oxo-dGTP pyrophosphatase MutT (NUDIX family)